MMPRGFWIARLAVAAAGLGLQLTGMYALVATFGGWVTLSLYGGCALVMLIQQVAARRSLSCSPGA